MKILIYNTKDGMKYSYKQSNLNSVLTMSTEISVSTKCLFDIIRKVIPDRKTRLNFLNDIESNKRVYWICTWLDVTRVRTEFKVYL